MPRRRINVPDSWPQPAGGWPSWVLTTPYVAAAHPQHVAVVFGGRLLHLSAEVGWPAVWNWEDFAKRDRYNTTVGLVRAQVRDPGTKVDL